MCYSLSPPSRLLETDSKSLRSVNGSRRNSGSSLVSSSSASSNLSHLEEDSWLLWGRIVNDWEEVRKKKEKQLKVGGDALLVSLSVADHASVSHCQCPFISTLCAACVFNRSLHIRASTVHTCV